MTDPDDRPPPSRRPGPAWRPAALVAWAAALAALTLAPLPALEGVEDVSTYCLVCGGRGASDAILNVVLFLPLGLLARGRSLARMVALGALLSAGIEGVQLLLPGRYPTLGDVVWNASGAGLGQLLRRHARAWLTPPAWAGSAAAAALGLGLLAGGWLLGPSWPRERYWGQWTAELGSMPQYRGTLLEASLGPLDVPPGRFPDGGDPRSILSGPFELRGLVVKGPPPPSLSPIVSIYDGVQREVVLLGADGEDLVWRERTRAAVARLDQPDLRLPGALAGVRVGDTVRLAVSRDGGERCLAAGERLRCGLGFTPGRTWSLLLWLDAAPERAWRVLDALWLALLLGPTGFLTRRGRRWGDVALAGAGLALAVGVTRLVAPPPLELLGALAGLGAGAWLRARLEGLRRRAAPRPSGASRA